jgi:hypothetical protein
MTGERGQLSQDIRAKTLNSPIPVIKYRRTFYTSTMTKIQMRKAALLTPLLLPFNWATADKSCYPQFRKVKLQSTTGLSIHMFEFQLLSEGVNIATNGNATQSMTRRQKYASHAIDENPTTYSLTFDADAWWQVDMGATTTADSISILNRWCVDSTDPNDCLCWISNATLSIFDEEDTLVFSESLGDTCGLYELNFDLSSCDETTSDEIMIPILLPPTPNPTLSPSLSASDIGVVLPSVVVGGKSGKHAKLSKSSKGSVSP